VYQDFSDVITSGIPGAEHFLEGTCSALHFLFHKACRASIKILGRRYLQQLSASRLHAIDSIVRIGINSGFYGRYLFLGYPPMGWLRSDEGSYCRTLSELLLLIRNAAIDSITVLSDLKPKFSCFVK
jgi:hypothetical protein